MVSSGMTKSLASVAEAGVDLSKLTEGDAAPGAPVAPVSTTPDIVEVLENIEVPARKYAVHEDTGKRATTHTTNVVLGALLPLTAVVSFLGGRSFANRRPRMTQIPSEAC